MLLTLLVFEQKGSVNDTFGIIPAIAYNKDNAKELNKKKILDTLRYDREKTLGGKYVLDENPSKDLSTIKFYYNPVMEKQQKYKNLPYKLTDTITVIDAFTCIGSRFGLDTLSVIVEVCQSNCGDNRIWANIYYVADSEIPACVIEIVQHSLFLEDYHIPQIRKNNKNKAFGNSLIGTWYCPKCSYTIVPNNLKRSKDSFIWSNKNKSTLEGFVGPHCKDCGTPMEYDEAE